jgi:hypothetical protein
VPIAEYSSFVLSSLWYFFLKDELVTNVISIHQTTLGMLDTILLAQKVGQTLQQLGTLSKKPGYPVLSGCTEHFHRKGRLGLQENLQRDKSMLMQRTTSFQAN